MPTLNEVLFRLTCLAGVIGSLGLLVGLFFLGRKLMKRWKQARQLEREMGVGNIHPSCKHGAAKSIKCEMCRNESEEFFKSTSSALTPEQRLADQYRESMDYRQICSACSSAMTSLPYDAVQNPYPTSRCLYCGHPEVNHSSVLGCNSKGCPCIAMKG